MLNETSFFLLIRDSSSSVERCFVQPVKLQFERVKKRKPFVLGSMFVLVLVFNQDRTRCVTFGVFELNGAVMNVKPAQQLIDLLQDRVAL